MSGLTQAAIRDELYRRMARQRAFFADPSPGQVLVFRRVGYPGLSGRLMEMLSAQDPTSLLDQSILRWAVDEYLADLEEACQVLFALQDDYVPSADIYFGIGSITAAMSGQPARFASGTSWCEPCIKTYDDLDGLRFDPDNVWVRLWLGLYQALLDFWREDFCFMPTYLRSPLDTAWGLRGQDIWLDLYDCPDRVDALLDRCVRWGIDLENHIAAEVDEPLEWGRAVWGTIIPAGAHFVNGDAVDLLNEALRSRFEGPSTAQLATGVNGLFFHHHQMGLRHAVEISRVPGLLVQQIQNAPKGESVAEVIVRDPGVREAVVEASLRVPIMLQGEPSILDELLSILKQGRFILTDFHHPRIVIDSETVGKVRAVSPI